MIHTKQDLKEYLKADKEQLGIHRYFPRPFTDEIWKYERTLRKYEYWLNRGGYPVHIMRFVYKALLHKWSVKLGIFIGPNTCGKGLWITHINCIQINDHATVGENLRIQEGVVVGGNGNEGAPTIGNNVFLGSGCKVIGNVNIPDGCVVGAGAVVVKSFYENGITIAGVPAKKISNKNSDAFIHPSSRRYK
jgi:serine O-acetyltransferase